MKSKRALLGFVISLSTLPGATAILQAQQPSPARQRENTHVRIREYAPDLDLTESTPSQVFTILNRNGESQVQKTNLLEAMRIIVEFKEAPLLIGKSKPSPSIATQASYEARFTQFAADLDRITGRLSQKLRTNPSASRIERRFTKIFFGASMSTPRAAIGAIQRLPYVKKIHLNKRVEATLQQSVPLIHADSVWIKYGVRGDSIVVGIIDTGIDYTHPLLGGGFGPGFKVIGGYDFVNDDPDPIDDNGHGTHVAGIVAADGPNTKGVAPGALLMGFKALNAFGGGFEDDIMAAIERTVDPNDDGDISDRCDVVNMSLGGFGHPDDAQSIAVDNATALGVTFCISAGNSGDFNTIGSPGTARTAITVGATDKSDKLADFSSRGPSRKIFGIKPEVLAPGVSINSAALSGGLVSLNGTSMSAPHVAGVSALLKSLHPDWGPAEIKSALMITAITIGREAMIQGAGRIDALRAAEVEVIISPSQLNFGLDDIAQTLWIEKDTLQVTNFGSQAKEFQIIFGGERNGVTPTATPESFTLPPNETQEVIVSLYVFNHLVSFPTEGSLAISGSMNLISEQQTLRVPWAFIKASRVLLSSDAPVRSFVLSNAKSAITPSDALMLDPSNFEINLPKGTYDLLVELEDVEMPGYIFRQNVGIDSIFHLSVSAAELSHTIEFAGRDENGRLLSSLNNSHMLLNILMPGVNETTGSNFVNHIYETIQPAPLLNRIRVSAFANEIEIWATELQSESRGESIMRVVHHDIVDAIDGDFTLTNDSDDFRSADLGAYFPTWARQPEVQFNMAKRYRSSDLIAIFGSVAFANFPVKAGSNWRGWLYLTPETHRFFRYQPRVFAMDTSLPEAENLIWASPGIQVEQDRVGLHDSFDGLHSDLTFAPGDLIDFGSGIIRPEVFGFSNRDRLDIFAQFFGAFAEFRSVDGRNGEYHIYDEQDSLISSGTLNTNSVIVDVPGQDRILRAEFTHSNYTVGPYAGTMRWSTVFDMFSPNEFPLITSILLRNSDNTTVAGFRQGDLASLLVRADNIAGGFGNDVEPVSVYYRTHGSETWVPATNNQGLFDLSPTTTTDSTAIDLRVVLQGSQELSTSELVLTPAYIVGDFNVIVNIHEIVDAAPPLPSQFALHANYPNPFNPSTTIAFDLPHQERVQVEIFNILGQKVRTLVEKSFRPGAHTIMWDGKDDFGRTVGSGVYLVQLRAGEFVASKKMLLLK